MNGGMLTQLAQGVDGLVTIVRHLPGQTVRTIRAMPPGDRAAAIQILRERLPSRLRIPLQDSEPALGAFKEGELTKAIPFVAIGIAGIVAYNIFVRGDK